MDNTPPRKASSRQEGVELTPEQVKRLEENRLRAKAKLQERERAARAQVSASTTVPNKRPRPLEVASADSTSPTAPAGRTNPTRLAVRPGVIPAASNALQNAIASGSGTGSTHFQRDAGASAAAPAPLKNMIKQYVDYDLAVLKNSRGGFLVEGEEDDPRKIRERELIEENKRKRLEAQRRQGILREPGIALQRSENPKCQHCGSIELDLQMRSVFGELVCTKCKQERPDEYSLLTKTECHEDYLLTDPELKDAELLPHLLRPNPHRPTYSNMMLFLRKQVEAFAFSDAKWGSPEALDAEFERRQAEKKAKKARKFELKLKELRKKTKTNVWHRRVEGEHKHTFDEQGQTPGQQKCSECGFEVDVEVF